MQNTPRNEPIFIEISMAKKRYSEPKLYIPKVDGKTTLDKDKPWQVYFYWRSDLNGPLDKKFTYRKGINRFSKIKERKAVGIALRNAYSLALSRGWIPGTKGIPQENSLTKTFTTVSAIDHAMQLKKRTKKQSTIDGYRFFADSFKQWLTDNNLAGMPINKFNADHFQKFRMYLRDDYKKKDGKPLSGKSINNYLRSISSLFSTLKKELIIKENVFKGHEKVEEVPVNNKAFTVSEIEDIKKLLIKKDPYLATFIAFIIYPLLRPREICRLKVGDIDLDNNVFSVETKTDALSFRRIIKKMKPLIDAMELEKHPKDYFLFSDLDKPKPWEDVKMKSRVDHFGRRFRKIKKEMGFGREYGLYSFRHSAIMDLYNSLLKQGLTEQEIYFKLMPITQHKSISGLKNYLRNHKRAIPKDHSDIFTIDF